MHGNAKLPKSLGKRIKKERKDLGWTQEQLAEKVDISTVYVGFIEQGRYAPSLDVLQKIAKHLRIPIKDLF